MSAVVHGTTHYSDYVFPIEFTPCRNDWIELNSYHRRFKWIWFGAWIEAIVIEIR